MGILLDSIVFIAKERESKSARQALAELHQQCNPIFDPLQSRKAYRKPSQEESRESTPFQHAPNPFLLPENRPDSCLKKRENLPRYTA